MTKLSDTKIRWICRHIAEVKDWKKKAVAELYGISVRRVEQVVRTYIQTGSIPRLKKNRRPKASALTQAEVDSIDQIWKEKRFGARMVFHELKNHSMKIPLHKIHAYMVKTGKTIPDPKKKKKRKRCRYEREHSFSLVHGDWHRTSEEHPHAIVWLDDASRNVLSGGEFEEATMEHSIETFKAAEVKAREYNAIIREANTDRGTQFYNVHGGLSKFQEMLIQDGIRHIPSRRNNPQTNGKVERFWLEYDRHRWTFGSLDEFISWYNRRLHGALWLEIGECPDDAVWRKSQPESILGLFWGLA
jgi:putative transposase